MPRRVDVDELNQIARLFSSGSTVRAVCQAIGCGQVSLYQRIRRNSAYIVSRLNPSKYTTLKHMLDKNKPTSTIAITIDLPETLINEARKLVKANDYPPPSEKR